MRAIYIAALKLFTVDWCYGWRPNWDGNGLQLEQISLFFCLFVFCFLFFVFFVLFFFFFFFVFLFFLQFSSRALKEIKKLLWFAFRAKFHLISSSQFCRSILAQN